MTMRKTPYQRLRYPWASDVVDVADVQSLASDIDSGLVQTAALAGNFARMSSASVRRSSAQSIAKSTLTAISFDTLLLDNGTDSPMTNGAWYNALSPTRLTAPIPCVVLAFATASINYTSVAGSPSSVGLFIARNGATGIPDVQGSKYGPTSAATNSQYVAAMSMWNMAAGDYLEAKVFWNGTPSGPLNTSTVFPPTMSLMVAALPSVA